MCLLFIYRFTAGRSIHVLYFIAALMIVILQDVEYYGMLHRRRWQGSRARTLVSFAQHSQPPSRGLLFEMPNQHDHMADKPLAVSKRR